MPKLAACIVLAVAVAVTQSAAAQSRLKQADSKYYQVFTDLDDNAVREVKLRVDAMAETYHDRTRGFSGQITKRMPFYLYSNPADYYAAGGMEGSAGVFDGQRLMAIAMPKNPDETWHVVQHEGFHQFVHAVIGGDMPIWVNEGLAEYFGEGIFTGDSFVTGVVPPQRLARIKAWIKSGKTISIQEMMNKSHEEWNSRLSLVNYDQAWSMVHFLAHAENGRYQDPFAGFIKEVSRNVAWQQAWEHTFGRGVREFEQKWRDYWQNMGENESLEMQARATLLTLTSFYGRAFSQKQIFESFDPFLQAAREGQLKSSVKDWLPPALLQRAVKSAEKMGGYAITKGPSGYKLVQDLPDGTKLVGTFKAANGQVRRESIEVESQAPKRRRP